MTLDSDVVRLLTEAVHRKRKPMKQVVNDALRRGLGPSALPRRMPRYRLKPHRAVLRPGLDRAAFNRLADELEDEVPRPGKRRAR